MKKLLRAPVRYHGGKYYLWRWITSYFPKHRLYVEPFGGAGWVILNKDESEEEIYNDLEYSIYNLLFVIKTDLQSFLDRINQISYSRDEYLNLRSLYYSEEFKTLSKLEQAVITYSVRRMSRAGTGGSFCWSSRTHGGMPGEVCGWETMKNVLPRISERLTHVQMFNEDGLQLIQKTDADDVLFYLDPPYVHQSRVAKSVYLEEMSLEMHENLATLVKNAKAKVILSGYRSKHYDEWYAGWNRVEKQLPNHASHRRAKEWKTECLWMNF